MAVLLHFIIIIINLNTNMYICVYAACMEYKAYCILIQTKTKQLQYSIAHFTFYFHLHSGLYILFIAVATSS